MLLLVCARPGCRARERSKPLEGLVELALGGFHTCARDRTGAVWCWGMNHRSQVGAPSRDSVQTAPVRVAGLTNVRQLALGDDHSCALHGDGTVSCWGGNAEDQFGDGTTEDRATPVVVR